MFESPPGHENDGLDGPHVQVPTGLAPSGSGKSDRSLSTKSVGIVTGAATDQPIAGIGHRRTASRDRMLGSRSVGFPGFGPILESQEAAAVSRGSDDGDRPLGRTSSRSIPAARGPSGDLAAPESALGRGSVGNLPLKNGKGGSHVDLPSLAEDEPEVSSYAKCVLYPIVPFPNIQQQPRFLLFTPTPP